MSLFPALSPSLLALSLSLCFLTLSGVRLLCLKSKLPRPGCLSPEAVIDRLTKKERERDRETREGEIEGESESGQAEMKPPELA